MSIEPQTGYVRAWVGGNNYRYFKYDHVKAGRRQVGSTFKPFLYTLAMQEGYSPCFKVPNVRVTIPIPGQPDWSPSNSDGKYGGMLTLKEALAESVNSVSAYLMKQFGPKPMIEIARKMGITSPIDEVPSRPLTKCLLFVWEHLMFRCLRCVAHTAPLPIKVCGQNPFTLPVLKNRTHLHYPY